MEKIYRHVFFQQRPVLQGNGSVVVKYRGKLFGYAASMRGFSKMYDPRQDLYVACGKCA